TFVLAWTTTPWTLIGNVALAVNSKLSYVKVEKDNQFFILAKDRLDVVMDKPYKVIDTLKGKALLGKDYEPLYVIPSDKKGHYIIDGGSDVSSEDGTGIVHMAIYGEFDYEMIKKHNLPIIQHVNSGGKLVLGPKEWLGNWFKKSDKLVLDDLNERNLLFKADDYAHSYPFCYRCETPLFYNAVDSWFVNIQKIKPRLIEKNEEINWYPGSIKHKRAKNIIETAPDWTISRNRYWGTSIPMWVCDDVCCGKSIVIGSIAELKEHAIEKVQDDVDLHKHIVDKIHLKCDCGKKMTRIPEILDCWFESGSMPFAAKHYPFENKAHFDDNYPSDFVSEYVGQVRTWFYYMNVLSVILFDKIPFKNVVVSGNILAEDGSKMSKSKKNFPSPNKIFEQYGADCLRFYLMSSQLTRAQDMNFREDGVKEIYRKLIMLLGNVNSFYGLFGKDNTVVDKPSNDHIMDRWIVSEINLLIKGVTKSLEEYDTITASSSVLSFIDELSTWYVRRSRDRFKSADQKTKDGAIKTLAYVLVNLSKVMAPITPFIAESIYLSVNKETKCESVHLESWPKAKTKLISIELSENMDLTRDIVSKSMVEREKCGIPVKQVLASLEISGVKLEVEYLDLIKEEVNVKKVNLKDGKTLSLKFDTKLTDALIQEGLSRDLIHKMNGYRKELKLTIENRIELYIETTDKMVLGCLDKFADIIKHPVQADLLELKIPQGLDIKELSLGGAKIKLAFKLK
ncbi:MAG: class I tRNA ligase family protein, partial [DPANN group archaeon]|nr:class I tRNA ligase family protein [DPANN group archaeon]